MMCAKVGMATGEVAQSKKVEIIEGVMNEAVGKELRNARVRFRCGGLRVQQQNRLV